MPISRGVRGRERTEGSFTREGNVDKGKVGEKKKRDFFKKRGEANWTFNNLVSICETSRNSGKNKKKKVWNMAG